MSYRSTEIEDEERQLKILLSAVASVLNKTGCISKICSNESHSWNRNNPDHIIEVEIAVSKIRDMDVRGIREAMSKYVANQSEIDKLRKENAVLRQDPGRAQMERYEADRLKLIQIEDSFDRFRRDHNAYVERMSPVEQERDRLKFELAQVKTNQVASTPVIAQPPEPPAPPPDIDGTVARFAMMELD